MYIIKFENSAADDLLRLWKENAKYVAKLLDLIFDIKKGNPYEGIGKPEELKHDFGGWWSRRIKQKHRLVYKLADNMLIILACYGHYDD